MLYGVHKFGEKIEDEKIYIKFDREYIRATNNERVEKVVVGGDKFLINPVEPVNLPKEITRFLLIEFSKTVSIEPKSMVKLYVKFPVEIGVFVIGKKLYILDIFTFVNPKFTLYGEPRRGIVCRYFKSDVYTNLPEVSKLREGVMELTIKNEFDEWVNVKKAVFDGYGMKIYYSDFPSMVATMKIENKSLAETSFSDKPLSSNMKKSLELYTAKRFIERKKFTMEWGYS